MLAMLRIPCLALAAFIASLPDPPQAPIPLVAPAICGFSPTAGRRGSTVTVLGTGLTGATLVTIGGAQAPFTPKDDGSLTAQVPDQAVTGPIAVQTPAGAATSGTAFTVEEAAPALTGFSPAQGPVGSTVTLTGSGFTPEATVAFHETPAASVTFVDATRLTARVPEHATSGTLTVTTAWGSATSVEPFTVTPAPGKPKPQRKAGARQAP